MTSLEIALGALTELRIAAERAATNPTDRYLNQQLRLSADRAKAAERTVGKILVREYLAGGAK